MHLTTEFFDETDCSICRPINMIDKALLFTFACVSIKQTGCSSCQNANTSKANAAAGIVLHRVTLWVCVSVGQSVRPS